ncbi:cupin domain-containing protein [Aspergillus novofumigatus IBT 16806]|uniref:Cupin domain protein n=1 Tax=Aspergillus novofumigatus (strain IBT 16806) TaxID=1392255 RepID=A0A2I1CK37_ASPN1|nr:cupin domain protein [Aspergillus novofumigatus IBT 16806]PKX97987.1 cupin domain protein [Aspergillus novofumigatus IBT 16806]
MSTNPGQVSPLAGITRYITTHNPSGQAIIHSEQPTDIKTHEQLMQKNALGLVNPGGTVCRFVDFGPGGEPFMHRTQSLDYGIVLQGEIEMILDSGEKRMLKPGDIAVQRGTKHAWRNPSEVEWSRMVFILQDIQPIVIGGLCLGRISVGRGRSSLVKVIDRCVMSFSRYNLRYST